MLQSPPCAVEMVGYSCRSQGIARGIPVMPAIVGHKHTSYPSELILSTGCLLTELTMAHKVELVPEGLHRTPAQNCTCATTLCTPQGVNIGADHTCNQPLAKGASAVAAATGLVENAVTSYALLGHNRPCCCH